MYPGHYVLVVEHSFGRFLRPPRGYPEGHALVSLLRMSSCVVDVLFSALCIPRHFTASVLCLVDIRRGIAFGIQSPLCTHSVGSVDMLVDDQFATYDMTS